MQKFKLRFECNAANVDTEINVSELSAVGISRAVRTACVKKLKLNFAKLLFDLSPVKIFCAWCGDFNHSCYAEYDIDIVSKIVKIKNIKYKHELQCCYKPKIYCEYKSLNANSNEFVSRSRGISTEEAQHFILARNKSPFYKHNHLSDIDYVKYQGTRCYSSDEQHNKSMIEKQNYSRSLLGYQDKFGFAQGTQKWRAVQKQKAITVENLTRKYGSEEIAFEKVEEWKQKTALTLENFIKKHGEHQGIKLYKDAVKSGGKYSKISFTKDGSCLRSGLERTFYEYLIKNGVEEDDILIDKPYPGSSLRYDFYIKPLKCFIEIAGCTGKEYNNKMKLKNQEFGAVIIKPKKIILEAQIIVDRYLFLKRKQNVSS